MDELDFRLLVALTEEPFASQEHLGRRIGRSGTTVAARLDRLRAIGAWQGLHLVPDPHALGRRGVGLLFEDIGDTPVDDVPGAVWSARFADGSQAFVVYADATEGPRAHVERIAEQLQRDPAVAAPLRMPEADSTPLSPLDWRIIRALLDDPRRRADELARTTGLSRRTAQRRRERLLATGHLVAFPCIQCPDDSPAVVHHLFAFGDHAPEHLPATAYPYARFHEPAGVAAICHARDTKAAQATAERIAATPGVENAESKTVIASTCAAPRVAAWIEAAAAHAESPRRPQS